MTAPASIYWVIKLVLAVKLMHSKHLNVHQCVHTPGHGVGYVKILPTLKFSHFQVD